ncbi:MAG: enoyl-CoA hydratase/isomerase family protein, partial [Alphaproteobacteria bacterium]|nr:enoyl-CoA hydratase/isomerase family protein [Alphaproteobacteria bacterium]
MREMSNAPAEKPVIIEHKGGVTSLKMNRPDRLNAVNADLIEGLLDGLDEAVTRGASLVVFTGVGRAFSAGFDLSGLDQQSDAELLYRFVRVEELLQTIYRL